MPTLHTPRCGTPARRHSRLGRWPRGIIEPRQPFRQAGSCRLALAATVRGRGTGGSQALCRPEGRPTGWWGTQAGRCGGRIIQTPPWCAHRRAPHLWWHMEDTVGLFTLGHPPPPLPSALRTRRITRPTPQRWLPRRPTPAWAARASSDPRTARWRRLHHHPPRLPLGLMLAMVVCERVQTATPCCNRADGPTAWVGHRATAVARTPSRWCGAWWLAG